MTRPTVLVAGGGTGGHVFPGIAVADALAALADVDVVFCGTARGVESRVVPAAGFRLELLDVEPMKGGGLRRALRGAVVAALAMRHARRLVRELRPVVALSVGGYAAGPAALASALGRVPLALLEPNGTAGLANRLLSPLAARAYLAWASTERAFRPRIRRMTGMPLRATFRPTPLRPADGRKLRLLVLGGSQGASALNARVPEAIGRLAARGAGLEIVHQTGRGKEGAVREVYAATAATARVVEFLDAMPEALAEADIVLARSGASTVAEIACIGRPAIFVPFPDAADDHQTTNASGLVEAGAAVCVAQGDASPDRLAAELQALLGDGALRARMADSARAQGRPSAASDIAADLLSLARVSPRRPSAPRAHVIHPETR